MTGWTQKLFEVALENQENVAGQSISWDTKGQSQSMKLIIVLTDGMQYGLIINNT